MKKNMGTADRVIRLLLAVVFTYLYFNGVVAGFPGILLMVFATVFLLTSVVSFCPLYTLFGWNTCKSAGK
jgi:hypothetical protein